MNAQSTVRAKQSSGNSNKHPTIGHNAKSLENTAGLIHVLVCLGESARLSMQWHTTKVPASMMIVILMCPEPPGNQIQAKLMYTVVRGTYAQQWQQSLKNIGKEILPQPQVCCEAQQERNTEQLHGLHPCYASSADNFGLLAWHPTIQ